MAKDMKKGPTRAATMKEKESVKKEGRKEEAKAKSGEKKTQAGKAGVNSRR